ncbi:hypothetical protein [Bacillus sp. AFS040349]|uniref:hypothetical protein n=1 Tax=Bacillus sp. AFS040349 TaxID=2033502 RepID=UPI000BFC820B|nr:hypothetical protein [Bacillus sp. AFS040349]PGT80524.1 hypothetical protein COD11_21165 [Bacillus sp. AFS040349]
MGPNECSVNKKVGHTYGVFGKEIINPIIELNEENVIERIPNTPGLYFLGLQTENCIDFFYVGKGRPLKNRLYQHAKMFAENEQYPEGHRANEYILSWIPENLVVTWFVCDAPEEEEQSIIKNYGRHLLNIKYNELPRNPLDVKHKYEEHYGNLVYREENNPVTKLPQLPKLVLKINEDEQAFKGHLLRGQYLNVLINFMMRA